jgi:hypothetical protein
MSYDHGYTPYKVAKYVASCCIGSPFKLYVAVARLLSNREDIGVPSGCFYGLPRPVTGALGIKTIPKEAMDAAVKAYYVALTSDPINGAVICRPMRPREHWDKRRENGVFICGYVFMGGEVIESRLLKEAGGEKRVVEVQDDMG